MTTPADLIATIRSRTNLESSQFVSDTELLGYVNSALAELYVVLENTYEDYSLVMSTATISTPVEGSNFFTLPADCERPRGVDLFYGGRWISLQGDVFKNRNRFNDGLFRLPSWLGDVRWRVTAQKVWITPATASGGQYQFWYVPRFTKLQLNDSLMQVQDNIAWHEYVINTVAVWIQTKQDLDPSIYMALKDKARLLVLDSAKPRNQGMVECIQDERLEGDDYQYPGWRR